MPFFLAIDSVAAEEPELAAISVAHHGVQSIAPLSYGSLADSSRRVARALLAHGVRTRDAQPVATMMARGPEWYCVYVATSRLGTPLVALSVDLRTDVVAERLRNSTILSSLRPQVCVLSHSEHNLWLELCSCRGPDMPPEEPKVLFFSDLVGCTADAALDVRVCADDLLCYAHTGGTTSRQRCVRVAHRMATHEIRAYPEAFGRGLFAPRVLQPSSLHWAAAVYGQLDLAIAFRGCAVVSNTVDTWELAEVLRHEQIAVLGLPPSLLALLRPSDMDHRSLKVVISWGEACPVSVAKCWGAPGLPWYFYDLLISTEYWLGLVGAEWNHAGKTLFDCVSGMQFLVCRLHDGNSDKPVFEEVADGEVGELCIGGLGVCPGFVGCASEEAAAFMIHDGRRFFRSGDLVVRSGKRLSFAGRGDEMVKVSGRWVDLNDLARRLAGLPSVVEAAALTTGTSTHSAAIVLSREANEDEVAVAIAKVLPASLGISVHILQTIPRKVATQKVDREGLRAAISAAPALTGQNVRSAKGAEPRGSTSDEEPLASVRIAVAEALGLNPEHVRADASFLELGGDSATAVRAVSLAADKGLRIHALSLLAAESLRSLLVNTSGAASQPCAAETWQRPLSHERGSGHARRAINWALESTTGLLRASGVEWSAERREISRQLNVPSCAIDEVSTCSPLQEAMLSALDAEAQGLSGSAGLLQTCAVLRPGTAMTRFHASWAAAHNACPMLRTAFARLGGSYFQVLIRPGYVAPPQWVVGQVSLNFEAEIQQWLDADAARGFNLQRPGLYRLALLQVPDGRQVLVFTVHNAVCDAWSCNALLSKVLAAHTGETSFQVQQWSGKLTARIFAERDVSAYAAHWAEVFRGFLSSSAKTVVTQPVIVETEVTRLQTSWQSLRRRAADLHVTPAVLVHVAWAMVWAQLVGCMDTAIGSVLSGREASGEMLLGMTLSLLPLRFNLSCVRQSVEELIVTSHRQLLELLKFQHCSLHELRAWSDLPSESSLFDSVIIFENAPLLPKELLQSAGYTPLCEREVPMANAGLSVLEFRISHSSQDHLQASARGRLPCKIPGGGESGVALIRVFDSLLTILAKPSVPGSCQDVHTLLQVLPLLPWANGRSPSELCSLRNFWQASLAKACNMESLDIPTDAPRRAIGDGDRVCVPSTLPWGLSSPTPEFAGDFSWKAIVLAAWALILAWQAGQDEVLIGVLLDVDDSRTGTSRGGSALPQQLRNGAVCCFPLLCKIPDARAGSVGFRSFAEGLEDKLKAADAHGSVPRWAVESALQCSSCEIRALFASGRYSENSEDARLCLQEAMESEPSAELALWVPHGMGRGLLSYDASVLDLTTVEQTVHRLEKYLSLLLTRNQAKHSLLTSPSLALGHEISELLHGLGTGESEPMPEKGVADFVSQQALRTPHCTAISAHDATLSYRNLHNAALVVGTRLLQGVDGTAGCVDTVGLLAERSAAMVVGMLASLYIGAAYVPLGPTMPLARLEHMLSLAKAQVLAVEPRLLQLAASLQRALKSISVVSISNYLSDRGQTQIPSQLSPRAKTDLKRPMYILFTSGSTGLPKMVRAASPSALSHLIHVIRRYRYSAFDIGLQHTAPGWVAAMPEIWSPLLVGGHLAVAPGGSGAATRDLEALAAHPVAMCASLLQHVPSVLAAFLRAGFDAVGPACRHLVLTGEPLPTDLCQQLLGRGFTLRNHYGQTEVADTTTVYTVEHPLPRAAAVPIGQPATHRLVWLRRSDGLATCGEGGGPGEIVVAGPGLLLASVDGGVVEDSPFGVGCAFGTGDLGRWVGQACEMVMICLGRQDRQVKIRGHRIELAEVETVLREEGACILERPIEVAVIVASDVQSGLGSQLYAYVCPLGGESVQVKTAILARCATRLPSYMVPATVTGVVDWPRTSTGKLDRKALPPPKLATQHRAQTSKTVAATPCAPRVADPRLFREKLLRISRAIFAGVLASRFRVWRMALLPYVWFAYAETFSCRREAMRGFHEEVSQRLPYIVFFLGSFALPSRVFLMLASAGAYLAGWRRVHALPVLWWLGLSNVDSWLETEISWYSWYFTPSGLKVLLQSLLHVVRDFHILPQILFFGSSEVRKDWSVCDWDQKPRWARWRPGCYHIDVDEEPVHSADAVAAAGAPLRPIPARDDLSPPAKVLLAVLEAEAKRAVSLTEALASVFDSLRMMGFVVAARQATGLSLTLHDVLKCDVVADLLELPAVATDADGSKSAGSRARNPSPDKVAHAKPADRAFRIAEWPYMFRLSICFALASDHCIDEGALEDALRDLTKRHEALRTELADPPSLFEFAMEAAGNLALMRSLVNRGCARNSMLLGSLFRQLCRAFGAALHCAWPRVVLRPAGAVHIPVDVVRCADHEQAERRSGWLLDGRNGRRFLQTPLHAVLLRTPSLEEDGSVDLLHVAVSHGLCDGFSGLPLLQDLQVFYAKRKRKRANVEDKAVTRDFLSQAAKRQHVGALDPQKGAMPHQERKRKAEEALMGDDIPSSLCIQERRLRCSLLGEDAQDAADLASPALPSSGHEAYDHFVRLAPASLQTLARVSEQRRWCCSLDIALLAVLACALARLRADESPDDGKLRLRFTVAVRDGTDEGQLIADFADYRDLDLTFTPCVGVEAAARAVATCIRHRQWRLPEAMTDGSERIFLNFRPLLEDLGAAVSHGEVLRHRPQWPPMHGEWNWEKRNIHQSMWIMADQVGLHEWVLYLKVQWAKPGDAALGEVLKHVLRDIALSPDSALLPKASRAESNVL